jgi:hypothetical protein
MADLSPAAQAVLDAMYQVNMDFSGENAQLAAAALRAAVEQCAYKREIHPDSSITETIIEADDLLAIATELDNNYPTH